MKKKISSKISVLMAVIMLGLTACGGGAPSGGGSSTPSGGDSAGSGTTGTYGNPNAPIFTQENNPYASYTAKEFGAIPFEDWCKKVDEVGISYEFNGQYTEAFAIQLNPTYFDCYLFNDGTVYGTYNADYVASNRDHPEYNGGGDGHADSESFLGWWYNQDEDGEQCLIMRWQCYMDYESNHVIPYTIESAALPAPSSGFEYQASVSLTYNGNSRTCFIYGGTYSNYKKDTLKVDVSGAPGSIAGAGEVQSDLLRITCERENGKTVEVPTYLFDYSFDTEGNVTIDYPILGLRDTSSYKLSVTPTVYNTQIKEKGAEVDETVTEVAGETTSETIAQAAGTATTSSIPGMKDVQIIRDSSDTAILVDGDKQARFAYDIEYYRNIMTILGYVDDPANTMTKEEFDLYETKYYFMGYSMHIDVQGEETIEVISAPDGDYLTPELAHYVMGDPSTADKCHFEPTKGPGVFSEDYEFIRFREFVLFRYLVTSNGEWIANKAPITTLEDGVLTISSFTKYGNNVNGRATATALTYRLDDEAGTVTVIESN